ncbi:MAG: hypothetical protein LBJ18_01170 [Rickettsiales bacterium]|jgi:hypothetical protein|nr:hypothetical protein [Rickettsiales bacterium]
MRRLIAFFAGLLILGLAFAALYFSGAIYDAGDQSRINAYIFQPADFSTDRVDSPKPIEQLSESALRDRLIAKFIYEYFYVIPVAENIAERTKNYTVMQAMSMPDVFSKWKRGEAQAIEKLSEQKMLRRVSVAPEILQAPDSDYWQVYYELQTFENPNLIDAAPVITPGVAYMKINFKPGIKESEIDGAPFDATRYLERGGDPAAIFKFKVVEIIIQ